MEQGGRILDAVARSAEKSSPEDLAVFMQSTWEAYMHFETVYLLDGKNRIKVLVPFDPRYIGVDMSRLPDIQKTGETNRVTISSPFASLRTGDPTVYLVRPLPQGGHVVGELNLGAFQQEIVKRMDTSRKDSIFILDQFGTLLAHPNSSLVKQQTNLGYLKIFHYGSKGKATVVYEYMGAKVLGSASRVSRVGWVVVDQTPLSVLLGPYAYTLGMMFLVSLGIWWMVVWNLRKKLHRNIVTPIVRLSESTDALAIGDFSRVNALAFMPAAFTELNKLAADFLHMSNALQARQTDLQKAQEELIRAEKLSILGRLAGVVGHEIRNPLGVINNAVYFLKTVMPDAGDTVKEYLDIIKQEIDNSQRIITDLLDFARTKTPQLTPITLGALVTRVLAKCNIPESTDVQTDIPDVLPEVNVDPFQIGQVLQNLITNAVQAMPEGGSLCINAREVQGSGKESIEPDGDFVEISVSDTGGGISPENMKKLFQPLFTTKTKGIGLGLVVCRNLVEANGGRIEVVTQSGRGSTFTIILPYSKGA
ncbi:MAG: ATP-binding protein [Syntrophales bacterium]|nr:ATP-binding protein [Syntrophales bacterium]